MKLCIGTTLGQREYHALSSTVDRLRFSLDTGNRAGNHGEESRESFCIDPLKEGERAEIVRKKPEVAPGGHHFWGVLQSLTTQNRVKLLKVFIRAYVNQGIDAWPQRFIYFSGKETGSKGSRTPSEGAGKRRLHTPPFAEINIRTWERGVTFWCQFVDGLVLNRRRCNQKENGRQMSWRYPSAVLPV